MLGEIFVAALTVMLTVLVVAAAVCVAVAAYRFVRGE